MDITTGNVSETTPLPSVLNADDVVRFRLVQNFYQLPC